VDTSLVVVDEQPDGTARYRLPETLRQYAQQTLAASGGGETVAQRHAAYFLSWAEAGQASLHLPRHRTAARVQRLEAEHDNLRAGLRFWTDRGQVEQGLRLALAIWDFWFRQGYVTEGRTRLAALLGRVEGAAGGSPRVAPTTHGLALLAASRLAHRQGDGPSARAGARQAAALWRALGDRRCVAEALGIQALAARDEGAHAEARQCMEESLALWREIGDRQGVARSTEMLATVAHAAGDLAAARRLYDEGIALLRAEDDGYFLVRYFLAWALQDRGRLALEEGDPAAARALGAESLAIRRRHGDTAGIVYALSLLAGVAAVEGQPRRALCLTSVITTQSETGFGLGPLYGAWLDRWLAPARRALSPEALHAAGAEGRTMTLEQAVAYALEDAPDAPDAP
jgi:non-specific serine/threonine protein kinase